MPIRLLPLIYKEAVSTRNLEKIRTVFMNAAAQHSLGQEVPANINNFMAKFHEKTFEGHQKNTLYDLFHKATGKEIMGSQRGFKESIGQPEIGAFEKLQGMLSPHGKDSELKRVNTGDISDKIEMSGRHKNFRDKIILKQNVDRRANSSGQGIHPLYVHKGYTFGEGGAFRRNSPSKEDYTFATGTPEVTLRYLKNSPEAVDRPHGYSDPSTISHYINTYNISDFKDKVRHKLISPYTRDLGKPTLNQTAQEIAEHKVLGSDLKTDPINHISNYEKTINTMALDKRKRLSSGNGWQQVAGKARTPVDVNFGFTYHPNVTGKYTFDISKTNTQQQASPRNPINQQHLNIV
jgi:hypothetical protein